MTGSNGYQLSYDEQQAAKQRMLAVLRVKRLKEVRAQDRQLAKQRNRVFQDLCVDSAQQLQQQLICLITQQRDNELACLQVQYAEALAGLASAQHQAVETEQQLALQAQQKHRLYLQRQAEAQERFETAVSKVRSARQSELQAVLGRVQRRQQMMVQERGKAKEFTEQAKESAARKAQQQAELDLQEEQRRRLNQVSRIDFKYSRLHELGVPQLVVNHRDLPRQGPDAATQAQQEASWLQQQQQAQVQQQQENARKAADRGISAQRLLQAEHNRHRMEQALQELEGNTVQKRQQDLAANKLTAAPLLRKWHKQKQQAQARRAFESDFLSAPAASAQQGLPSFVAVNATDVDAAAAEQEQQEHERQRTPTRKTAAAADRALKLVQELKRQRQAETSAAAAEQEQQQQQRLTARRAAAAAAAAAAASDVSTVESEVPVEDLITFIPAISTADDSQKQQQPHGAPADEQAAEQTASAAAARTAGTAGKSLPDDSSSMGLTGVLQGDQSVADTLSALLDASGTAAVSGPSATAESGLAESLQQDFGAVADMNEDEAVSDAAEASSAAAVAAAGSTASLRGAVVSSKDSLDAIIAAADEVLRQLPADMRAAAAARAAALQDATAPRQREQQGDAAVESPPEQSLRRSVGSQGVRSSVQQHAAGHAADSSADAAAILAELRALQQQLGVQVLDSQSSDSALAQLRDFDADIEQLAGQQAFAGLLATATQMFSPVTRHQAHAQTAPAGAQGQVPGDVSDAAAVGRAAPTVPTATASVGLSEALATARQQLEAAAVPYEVEEEGHPVRTELDDLIDRILAPDYPSNTLPGPLAGPEPSTSSPTRTAGRAGRLAAGQHRSNRMPQGRAAAGPSSSWMQPGAATAHRASAAAAAAGGDQVQSDDVDLLEKLRALGMELKALGVSGAAEVAAMVSSSSDSSINAISSSSSTGAAGPAGAAPARVLHRSIADTASTSVTLPTTIMRAPAQQQQQQQQQQVWPPQMPPHRQTQVAASTSGEGSTPGGPLAPSVSVSSSAPSLSFLLQKAQESLAAAAAAGHPAAAAAGLMASMSAGSDSNWSLSASQEASLMTLQQLLGADSSAAAPSSSDTSIGSAATVGSSGTAGAGGEAGQHQAPAAAAASEAAPTSVVSLPSTLFRSAGGAGPEAASQAGSTTAAAPMTAGVAAAPAWAAEQAEAAAELPQDTYSLLRGLLSLSGSSSPETPGSPRAQEGPAAAAAAAAATAAGRGRGPPPRGLLASPGSISSTLSSMSDNELEQLLQKALAAAGSADPAAAAGAPVRGYAGAEGSVASIEAALEAMMAAAGPAGAADEAINVAFDQGSVSTTLPSTVLRGMQVAPATRHPPQQATQGMTAAVADAAAAALQRAKRSSRVRAVEASSASSGGDGSSSGGSHGSNSGERGAASGDASGSGSSSSSGGSSSSSLSLGAGPATFTGAGPAGISNLGEYDEDGSSSMLSLPSTVLNTAAATNTLQAAAAAAAAGPCSSAVGLSGDQHQQQQQQQVEVPAVQRRVQDGAPLTPILEEDELSASSASELLSGSTQEINALLTRLRQEYSRQGQQQPLEFALPAHSDTSGTISGTSSSSNSIGGGGGEALADMVVAAGANAREGLSGVVGGSSSSSRPDVLISSDSFSEVVSGLMSHIDSTIASLAAPSQNAAAAAAAAAAAGGISSQTGAELLQQAGEVTPLLQDELRGFSFGGVHRGVSSSGSAGVDVAGLSGAAGTTLPPGAPDSAAGPYGGVGVAAAAAGGGGGDSSSSAAAASSVGLGSSLQLSGISADTPTDSSTQRYVQRVLLGIMSSSSAATGTTATTASPDVDTCSSRRQPDTANPDTRAAVLHSTAALPSMQPVAATATAAASAGRQSSRPGMSVHGAGRGGAAAAASSLLPGPASGHPSGLPVGGLLSPESTSASSLGSSGATEALLCDVSSGSVVIGPSSSSSSSGGGGGGGDDDFDVAPSTTRQGAAGTSSSAALAAVPGASYNLPAAPAAGQQQATTPILQHGQQQQQQQGQQLHGWQMPASGPMPGPGPHFGGFGVSGDLLGSATAISSALRVAAETGGLPGGSYGTLLSPEGSSASEGNTPQQAYRAVPAPLAASSGAGSSQEPAFRPYGASSSSSRAAVSVTGTTARLQEPLPRAAAAVPAQAQQQEAGMPGGAPHSQQQRGRGGGGDPGGLAALLADIVSADPVLAQQLRQQGYSQQQ